jgi:hypothetical protein
MRPMRRSLVLVDETARNPFLQSLPPHVRQDREPRAPRDRRSVWLADLRHFLMAYCACFLAASVYFA